jgi:hypothetical protein
MLSKYTKKNISKWQPRKCLGLDMANLIIFISKNGEKVPPKSQNFGCLFN